MFRIGIILTGIVMMSSVYASGGRFQGELKDIYFGDALFYAYQQDYFDAISRLDTELAQYYGLDEPELNTLFYHIGQAEFSVGDFELFYRMHTRAGRAIKAVINGDVDEEIRNEAIYRLAKIYYQKQQFINAAHTIERIKGRIPEKLRYEEPFLRAQIYIVNGKFTEAIDLLRDIENAEGMKGFAGYNLAVALIKSGKREEGLQQLARVGEISASDNRVTSMRDKANLVLGYNLLESNNAMEAKKYLDRVRITGPFSNKALLGSGWAAVSADQYDRALVPWTILAKRNVTNSAVQEALMGVPYAYGKLGLYGKSAILYGHALESFSNEIDRLDVSIKNIREGKFLEAVIREELKKDKNWLVNLRNLPDTPETFYLIQMMASHDFQASLKNYFDLAELKRKMKLWLKSLDSFEDMIRIRSAYYEPLLPEIGKQFRQLDSKLKLRIAQRDSIDRRLKKMLIAPRPDFLATVDERISLEHIQVLEKKLKRQGKLSLPGVQARIDRMKGAITWNIHTEYQDRFSEADKHLRALNKDVEVLQEAYKSFVRTRQAATQSYKGYDSQIQILRAKINQAQEQVDVLMARQGHLIEVMAVNELQQRRQRLEKYQVKARFAMAESYDRATKKQSDEEMKKEQEALKKEQAREEENREKNKAQERKDEPEKGTDKSSTEGGTQ
ncbi:MAG: hypothetical protein P8Y24_08585 [Gammaproteobacteria bacterium]